MSYPNSTNLTSDINNNTSTTGDIICETLQCSVKLFSETIECDEIKAGTVPSIVVSNNLDLGTNNLTCNTLNYTTLNPPISGGAPIYLNAYNTNSVVKTQPNGTWENIPFNNIDFSGSDWSYSSGIFTYNGPTAKFQINGVFQLQADVPGVIVVKVNITNPQIVLEYRSMVFSNDPNNIQPGTISMITEIQTGQEIEFQLNGEPPCQLNPVILGYYDGSSAYINIHKI